MDGHTHLDRQVRQRGVCPGCDLFWQRQDERLTAVRPTIALTKQLDRMGDKPRRPTGQFCTAIFDGPAGGDPGRDPHLPPPRPPQAPASLPALRRGMAMICPLCAAYNDPAVTPSGRIPPKDWDPIWCVGCLNIMVVDHTSPGGLRFPNNDDWDAWADHPRLGSILARLLRPPNPEREPPS